MAFVKTFLHVLSILILTEPTKSHENEVTEWFEEINSDFVKYNKIAAEISWESSINPGKPELSERAADCQRKQIEWQHRMCGKLAEMSNGHLLNKTQWRQWYLLCRGPVYTIEEARETSALYDELQSIYYNAEVCIPTNKNVSKSNLMQVEGAILHYQSSVQGFLNFECRYNAIELAAKLASIEENKEGVCLKGVREFESLFRFSRNEKVLRWLWLVWREVVGPPMKEPYRKLVDIENVASKRNGYPDIGAAWRDELEIPDLRQFCRDLYSSVEPLYKLLHGVVRFYLRKEYGHAVPDRGPIPAHLLGNLWAQEWQSLIDLIIPNDINIDRSMNNMNWTVDHMVKRAEDFYQSLGLPPMTELFWQQSVFERLNDSTRCHGTAADMFEHSDFRLLYCADITADDFYVIHHEMGHIHYYMAYENQSGIFRQGANTAFHESIGDAIMYGVLTPLHLHRLGLINDSLLYTTKRQGSEDYVSDENERFGIEIQSHGTNTERSDEIAGKRTHFEVNSEIFNGIHANDEDDIKFTPDDVLLLKQALNKLPQIPFALLVDEYRFDYFEGSLKPGFVNEEFWVRALELQGIAPVGVRGEEYFDAGAKFHVPDNTPYVRYFLGSFLQHQLFEALCKVAVFGRRSANEDLPPSIALNRCDLYGSKAVGKVLRDLMSKGSSQHWRVILQATTGQNDISADSLKRYYRPLYTLLKKLVHKHGIPIGW